MERSLRISLSLPGAASGSDSAQTEGAILTLELSPSSTTPFVDVSWSASIDLGEPEKERVDRAVQSVRGIGVDVVEIVRRVVDGCLQ
jgi:hypothetical protein